MFLLFSSQCTIAQNVGIGTITPTGPLSFGTGKSSIGGRTMLFSNNNFGIGVADNDMVFSIGPYQVGSIVFGQGNSNAFAPVMRIQWDGNVGIGVAEATQKLDVAERIRSRYSNTTLTPGIMHSYTDRSGTALLPFFTGMADVNSIVMGGGGKGVLLLDGRNGALGLNFNYGLAGQVAVSNGNTNTATWQNPDFGYFNNIVNRFESNSYTLTDASPSATLGSFTIPFAMPKNSKIFVDYSIAANTTTCIACTATRFLVKVFVNGVLVPNTTSIFEVGNGRSTTACDGIFISGGTNFTVSVVVTKSSGPPLNLPASAGRTSSITILPVSQN